MKLSAEVGLDNSLETPNILELMGGRDETKHNTDKLNVATLANTRAQDDLDKMCAQALSLSLDVEKTCSSVMDEANKLRQLCGQSSLDISNYHAGVSALRPDDPTDEWREVFNIGEAGEPAVKVVKKPAAAKVVQPAPKLV